VLWNELIAEWRLANHEVTYINRQQGLHCKRCRCNLRSLALAKAIMRCAGYRGLFEAFVEEATVRRLRVLEINEAGGLTQFLSRLPGHVLGCYPEIDMLALPYPDCSFDLVVHSDTLEHVRHPVRALSECLRILRPGGSCIFTVPIVVDRLTIGREGLPPSYHGSRDNPPDCLVYTEYGADAWKHVIQAGFEECTILCLEYPAALALTGVKAIEQVQGEPPDTNDWEEQAQSLAGEIATAVPAGSLIVLVDEERFRAGLRINSRLLPFLEREGQYWGNPSGDDVAVRELERLRQCGASHLVVAWPSFWWLDFYSEFHQYLRSHFRCTWATDHSIVFDLQKGP
jgi:SAM-dependent methyltransferase